MKTHSEPSESAAPGARPASLSTATTGTGTQAPPAGVRWPLLARLPHMNMAFDARRVGQGPRPLPKCETAQGDYRIDPPVIRGPQAAPRPASTEPAVLIAATEPPGARVHFPARPAEMIRERGKPSVLPKSRLFDEDDELPDSLAPFIRFLILVALFTVAGTSVLMLYSGSPTTEVDPLPGANALKPVPVSATKGDDSPASRPLEARELIAMPASATTEREDKQEEDAAPARAAKRDSDRVAEKKTKPRPEAPTAPEIERAEAVTGPSLIPQQYPSTQLPEVDAAAAAAALPRVRAAQPSSAVAGFSGQIYEPQTRQAHHDNHESSIH